MQLDIGFQGLGILIALSLVFGVIAQLILGRNTTRWMWLIGAAGYFIGGLFASEVIFATATEDELQPIIDGLCFDEALLGGLIVGSGGRPRDLVRHPAQPAPRTDAVLTRSPQGSRGALRRSRGAPGVRRSSWPPGPSRPRDGRARRLSRSPASDAHTL